MQPKPNREAIDPDRNRCSKIITTQGVQQILDDFETRPHDESVDCPIHHRERFRLSQRQHQQHTEQPNEIFIHRRRKRSIE